MPRVGRLPAASFRSHLAVGTLAVRLGVPGIKASKGLAPSSHFPVGFRLPVASAVTALRAMPGTHREREGPRGLPPPTPPDVRVTYPAVRQIKPECNAHPDRSVFSRCASGEFIPGVEHSVPRLAGCYLPTPLQATPPLCRSGLQRIPRLLCPLLTSAGRSGR